MAHSFIKMYSGKHPYRAHLIKDGSAFYPTESHDEGCDSCGRNASWQTFDKADTLYLACSWCINKYKLPTSKHESDYPKEK